MQRLGAWLDASLEVHQTIGVETVLSTPKYRPLVEKARALGFEIRLIYVFVRTAEIQIDRIRLRVAKGGHDVPETKVRERRARSFVELGWFFHAADEAWLFDNSGATPQLVGRKQGGEVTLSAGLPEEVMAPLTA